MPLWVGDIRRSLSSSWTSEALVYIRGSGPYMNLYIGKQVPCKTRYAHQWQNGIRFRSLQGDDGFKLWEALSMGAVLIEVRRAQA